MHIVLLKLAVHMEVIHLLEIICVVLEVATFLIGSFYRFNLSTKLTESRSLPWVRYRW